MSNSGLFFSGAADFLNRVNGNAAAVKMEDGVLTAKEISRLDLRGLDLVVLSACQTGSGTVTGEGVFGLQRGFKKSGANTIVMSLWKVDDEATQILMQQFYKNLTDGNGMSKRSAFINARSIFDVSITENTINLLIGRHLLCLMACKRISFLSKSFL